MKVGEWRSCSEQLPPDGVSVIAYDGIIMFEAIFVYGQWTTFRHTSNPVAWTCWPVPPEIKS